MPNYKTVTFNPDQLGKAQYVASFDRAYPPYIGEHVNAVCKAVEGGVPVLFVAVVEQMSHESNTCLARPVETYTYESKADPRPTSTNRRPAASEVEQDIRRQEPTFT